MHIYDLSKDKKGRSLEVLFVFPNSVHFPLLLFALSLNFSVDLRLNFTFHSPQKPTPATTVTSVYPALLREKEPSLKQGDQRRGTIIPRKNEIQKQHQFDSCCCSWEDLYNPYLHRRVSRSNQGTHRILRNDIQKRGERD